MGYDYFVIEMNGGIVSFAYTGTIQIYNAAK